jgi:hypothetical protein
MKMNQTATTPTLMSTTSPFDMQARHDLSLKRRERSSMHVPIESTDNMESGSSSPFGSSDSSSPYGQTALQTAWDKLYRARAILEAEQAHLRDDRIALQGEVESLEMRERSVAARETRIRQLELQAVLDLQEQDEREERESQSTLSKLTRAPFEIARSVFKPKK